jgi:hypothetical protein
VMWEMEGRTTEEIAAQLGTTPANVRHVVQRARASFVRVLTDWIIDEETGTTALDALSTSYKKAAELAKKSSKVALSLILLLAAFVGFNSLGSKSAVTTVSPVQSQEAPAVNAPAGAPQAAASTAAVAKPVNSASPIATLEQKKSDAMVKQVDAKTAPLAFYGLNDAGLPTAFTVTDLQGHAGKTIMGKPLPVLTDEGTLLNAPVMTFDADAPGVLLTQSVEVTGAGTVYKANPFVAIKGAWTPLKVSATNVDIVRLPQGNYLVTSVMYIDSVAEAGILIPVGRALDISSTPTSITTRLLLDPGKTQILAQAIQVATKK